MRSVVGMKLLSRWIVLGLNLAIPLAAWAGSPRRLLTQPPILEGREIERFLLVEPIRRGGVFTVEPGHLVAVAEDDEGVFYQATSGFLRGLVYRPPERSPGGIHVSKRNPTVITTYYGDAGDPSDVMKISNQRLTFDEMRTLKVAKAAKPKRAK